MKKQEIYNLGKNFGIKLKDIDLILEKVTGLTKNQLFLVDEIDEKYLEKIKKFFLRLKNKEPIEYILENANFYSLDFFVDSRVLIPRNDTEIMVDKIVNSEKGKVNSDFVLIDVGTGSGCIPISIEKNLGKNKNFKQIFALDISKKALEVAEKNLKKYNLKNKIKLLNSDLLEKFLDKNFLENFNLENIVITANLPYIKNGDFENMDFATKKFEPDLALYGGEETGFELYEKLIFQIFELQSIYKIKKIILFIEIGFDQKEIAKKILEKQNLKFEIFQDKSGIDRCIKIIF